MPSVGIRPGQFQPVRFAGRPKRVSVWSPKAEVWALGLTPKGFDKFMRGKITPPKASPFAVFALNDPDILFEIEPTFGDEINYQPRIFGTRSPSWWVLVLGNAGQESIQVEYDVLA